MWRLTLAILLLGFLLFRLADWMGRSSAPAESAAADSATSAAKSLVYGEFRAQIVDPPAEIEMVGVIEFPSMAHCAQRNVADSLFDLCPRPGDSCRIESFECRHEVDTRYRRMLEGQPIATHYAHFQIGAGNAPERRRFVLVPWGLSVEDAMKLCTTIIEGWAGNHRSVATCI